MKEEYLQLSRTNTSNNSNLFKEVCIIVSFFILAISVVMQFYLLVAVPDVLCMLFSLETAQALNLTAMFGFFYATGLLVWGRLASIYTPKRIILIGLFLLCSVSLGLAVTTQYIWLVSLRSAQGFVAAAFPPAAILWLTENISSSRRITAIACISCGFLLSASLGQWLGTLLINQSLMLVMGVASLLYASGVILLSFLSSVSVRQQQSQSFLQDLTQIVRQRNLLKVYALTFFLFNSLIVFYSGVAGELRPILLKHGIHPTWFVGVAIPSLMLSLLAPPCIARFGSLSMVWFSALLLGTGHLLHLLTSTIAGGWIYVAHAIYTAGIGFAVPSLISFIGLSMPIQIKGTAISLYMFILFFGGAAGSFFISYTGVVPMITAQVCFFILISFWLGVDLIKHRKSRALALSIAPMLGANAIFAAQNSSTMDSALTYYKALSPKEQQNYTALWVASGNKVSGKVKTEHITLYRWQREPDLALGHDNVSIQVTDSGELSGFARYIPAAAEEPLPSKEAAEKTAREFLKKYAPDLLPVMNIQWINPHRDETYTDGSTLYHINGMKMKCRSTADGTYFWVIVGSDNTVIVFERDIEWDFIRAGRQTEKWLHDDWLQKNNIKFIKG